MGRLVFILTVTSFLSFQTFPRQVPEKNLRKTVGSSKVSGLPHFQILNVNKISTWFRDNGNSSFPPSATGDGTVFPRSTGSVIYEDGIIWGGKVFTDSAKKRPAWGTLPIRAGGNEYNQGCQAGRVTGFGAQAIPISYNDPESRIYRIRRDWLTMTEDQLVTDAAESYETTPTAVSQDQIDVIKFQYQKDWSEWPVQYGAPYIERNGVPGYQPPPSFNYDVAKGPMFTPESLITQKLDEPGVAGSDPNVPADEVVWTVYNDLNRSLTTSVWGSEPMGLEIQATLWAYNRTGPLGNVIFKRFRLINKGGVDTTGTSVKGSFWIDSMYVGQWSDPDLGNAGNDLLGCDTSLGLGYVYNSTSNDAEYDAYGLVPPSAGYVLLAGPAVLGNSVDTAIINFKKVAGKKNKTMTSFVWWPSFYQPGPRMYSWYIWVSRFYRMLRGYYPYDGPTDEFYPFPPGMIQSKFTLSGDPVQKTGFIDGLGTEYSPRAGDRRLLMASGPFSMAPGDTQEVYVALVAGLGSSYLNSIAVMKQVSTAAKAMFDANFSIVEAPIASATVSYPTSTFSTAKIQVAARKMLVDSVWAIVKRYNGAVFATIQLFDDGMHSDELANDGIFSNAVDIPRGFEPMFADILMKNRLTGMTNSWEKLIPNIVVSGKVAIADPVLFSDNLNGDKIANPGENIRYGFAVKNETPYDLRNVHVSAKRGDEIILTIPSIPGNSTYTPQYDASNPGTYLSATISGYYRAPDYQIPIEISDSAGNIWSDTINLPVKKFFALPYDSTIRHVAGPGEWDFVAKVVEPSQIRNHKYELAIVDSIDPAGSKGFTLTDLTTGDTLLRKNPLPDEMSHNIGVVDGFRIFRGGHFGGSGVSKDSSRWISTSPQWINGSTLFEGDGYEGFNGGIILAKEASSFFNLYWPMMPKIVPVELRFDSTKPQKAYRLLRDVNRTSNKYVIGRGYALHERILNGTISAGATNDTIYGVGTSFLNDFGANGADGSGIVAPGTTIRIDTSVAGNGAYQLFTVARVFSNTKLRLSSVPVRVFAGQLPRRRGDQPLAPLDTLPFVDVPFSAWDVSNPAVPRQVDISFRDPNRNGVWDPGVIVDYFNIYGSTYDPTGMKFGLYNPGGADDTAQTPNIAIAGPKADIMYVCDLAVLSGHVKNESPGIVRIQPWYGLTKYDRFQFDLRYDVNNVPPASFVLLQNYPNPFNPLTNIKFEVPELSDVSIKVYNLLGQDVATVFEGQKDVGRYVVQWSGRDRYGVQLPSGVYFYRMKVGSVAQVKKMLLIR